MSIPFHSFLITFITLVVLVACGEGDQPKSFEDYLSAARKHHDQGKAAAGIIELRNALRLAPDNVEARALLGKLYVDIRDWRSAIKELQRARELGDSSIETRTLLATALLQIREFQQVLDFIGESVDISTPPGRDLMAIRAQALVGTHDYDNPKLAFEMIIAEAPHSGALEGLARVAIARGDYEAADNYLSIGLKEYPEDVALLLRSGESLLQQMRYAEAQRIFSRAIDLEVNSIDGHLGLIRSLIMQNDPEAALKQLDKLPETVGDLADAVLLEAYAMFQLERYADAHDLAQRVLAAMPNHPMALYTAGVSAYFLNNSDTATNLLNQFLEQFPHHLSARKVLAASQIRAGEGKEAYETLTNFDEFKDDVGYLLLLSTASAQAGSPLESINYLEKFLSSHPEDVAARTRLGMLKLTLGETQEGLAALEHAYRDASESEQNDVEQLLGIAYLRTGELDKALTIAKRVQSQFPDRIDGYKLEAFTQIKHHNLSAAEQALRKSVDLVPGDFETVFNLTQIERLRGNFDNAKKIVDSFLQEHPDHLVMTIRLAEIEMLRGNPRQAERLLLRAVDAHPKAAGPRIGLGQQYLASEKPAKVLAVIEPGLSASPNDPKLLELAARAQLSLGRYREASSTLRRLVKERPRLVEAHLYLAQAFAATERIPRAIEHLNEALALAPDRFDARLSLARMLVKSGLSEQARVELERLKAEAPEKAILLDIEAVLASLDGNHEKALKNYRHALELSPSSERLIYLTQAQRLAGQLNQLEPTLQEWLDAHPLDTFVRAELAKFYLLYNNLNEAEAQYQELLKQDPNDSSALNTYAWILYKKGDTDKALVKAEQALALNPENPDIQDTLGAILLDKSEFGRALPLLRSSAKLLPGNPEVSYHLAQALLGTGQKEEAMRVLRETLAKKSQFQERPAATRLLENLAAAQ